MQRTRRCGSSAHGGVGSSANAAMYKEKAGVSRREAAACILTACTRTVCAQSNSVKCAATCIAPFARLRRRSLKWEAKYVAALLALFARTASGRLDDGKRHGRPDEARQMLHREPHADVADRLPLDKQAAANIQTFEGERPLLRGPMYIGATRRWRCMCRQGSPGRLSVAKSARRPRAWL